MGKANVSRQSLVEAIATLEAQRGSADGDRGLSQAVDTVLPVLREKLAQIQTEPGDKKRHQLAVLVADLSGFTTLSEHMDVERVREAINAMWRVLDAVIRSWGGQIDQHAGDSLMALFGLPHPRRGDAARALHAALAMQQELALFNERVRRAADDLLDELWVGEWPGPSMRVGVHSGPVFFARAPESGRVPGGRAAAVGDTITLTRRLERAAPAGGILASGDVQDLTSDRFVFTQLPVASTSPRGMDSAVLVAGERPDTTDYHPGTVAGQVTRFVGRAGLIDRLEMALQAAADSLSPQLVTIVGAPGAGKSRLVHEFEQRARLLGGSTVLRAGTQDACPDVPYALVRDLLLRRFAIRPQHSTFLIEAKLRQAMTELEWRGRSVGGNTGPLPQATSLLSRLLDARAAAVIPMEEVLAALVPLFRAVTAAGDPAIVVLEGLNRADRQSLELVERLVQEGEAGPVLFLGLATETLVADSETTLPWPARERDAFSPMERIDITPLSAVDSRLMATEMLHRLGSPSMRLLDLVVAEAAGNPLYIESFVQLLIDRGVIAVGDRWRVDMSRAEEMPLPAGLTPLVGARLAELPERERRVLQYAAVYGPMSWDTALMEVEMAVSSSAGDVDAALSILESKEYLVRDDVYSFGGAQAYAFRRDTVREAAYAAVPADLRCALHRAAARWLIANQDSARFGAWFPIDFLIAQHFAAAGDIAEANAWRQRAAIAGLSS